MLQFLTSAWIKTSPENYEPFMDVPVAEYCSSRIEPYAVEIDHVGLIALIDCLILPAGLTGEVIYLDRSAGDEVTVHRFKKAEGDSVLAPPDAPVLRLLYRPYVFLVLFRMHIILLISLVAATMT
jgi:ubiquitin thioesterase protein OTUB1